MALKEESEEPEQMEEKDMYEKRHDFITREQYCSTYELCGNSFTHKGALNTHIRSHTEECPYTRQLWEELLTKNYFKDSHEKT